MARMTTSRSAAAMSTAAVGDSPKMVVRSVTAERGRAEAPSSRRSSLFTVLELEVERSVLTLPEDRKSTRLNSSHRCISYAVFCLKKKKKKRRNNAHINN